MSCCGNDNSWNCSNPCSTGDSNSAACESLPSALDNFIRHFFGSVIKTEVNGQVTWSLPGNLEIGLPNNPRSADEGLAVYFLRLFNEGIIGLTGPKGDPGAAGADGYHGFSVTLESFTHPAVGSSVTVKSAANPAIQLGQNVFVANSGWYLINAISGDYTLILTLLESISGASGTIPAGRIITVTGPRGIQGAKGDQGDQGVKGDTGAAGDEYTPTNYFAKCTGANHSLKLAIGAVSFGGTEPELTLPTPGRYLVTFLVGVTMDATAAASPGEEITFRVWNSTAGAYEVDLDDTEQKLLPSQKGRFVLQAIIATSVANEQLGLYGQISVDDKAVVVPSQTSVGYVRLA